MEEDLKGLNPQIRTIDIGVRKLRKLTVYPLSLHDELALTDIITVAIAGFMESKQAKMNDLAFVNFVLSVIKKNISKIIEFVSDESSEVLKEITNPQASKLVEIIYKENFEDISKNLKSLSEKMKTAFQLERQLPPFVSTMDTPLNTSSDDPTQTEESQENS